MIIMLDRRQCILKRFSNRLFRPWQRSIQIGFSFGQGKGNAVKQGRPDFRAGLIAQGLFKMILQKIVEGRIAMMSELVKAGCRAYQPVNRRF